MLVLTALHTTQEQKAVAGQTGGRFTATTALE
jgi:hypothetical protein